ncbi:MAG: SUMF1/EgtB/PvdO family nonheme iron enzyme, partial [Parvularculaceae bacterium]|nr:SUMF1/EgtB/PvdO family nonheme iron enzyme [Parvularculaceae bacterium]
MMTAAAVLAAALFALVPTAEAKTPKVDAARYFKDCADCPEMARIPAGSFMMGIAREEEIRQGMPKSQAGRALPIHQVTFASGFAMARTPVTRAQFQRFLDESGHQPSEACYTQHKVDGHYIYERARGYSWRSPGFAQDER